MAAITIKKIAELAGVSTATVSNVIHGKTKKVSAANIQKIQSIINETGYNKGSSNEKSGRLGSKLLAVVINSHKEYKDAILSDPFYGKALGFIEQRIRQLGYYMIFYSAKEMDDIFKMVLSWDVDGVICLSFLKKDCEKIQHRIHKPVISIDAYGETDGEQIVPNIGLRDEDGGYIMTRHLLRCGYETIYVCASMNLGVDHVRWIGAQRAFKEWGDTSGKKLIFVPLGKSEYTREESYQNLERLFPFKKRTAFFFLADLFAIEAICYFSNKGIHIPDDVGIAGYDDILFSHFTVPALTTIHQDIREKAEYAVEEIIHKIEDENYVIEKECLLPVTLVIRDSV